MKTLGIIVGILFWSNFVMAGDQKTFTADCLEAGSVVCYDKTLNPNVPAATGTYIPPRPEISFCLREKGDFDNFGQPDVAKSPAKLDFQRKDGQDGSRVKLGLIMVGSAFNDTWQPFGSLAWNRDASWNVASRTEIRDAKVGVTGTAYQTDDLEWSLHSTVTYRYREDRYGTKDGNAFGLHASIVKLAWVNAKPFIFVPYFGLLLDEQNGGSVTDGKWESAYFGATLTIPLNNWIKGLSISGNYETFQDDSAPNGQPKRSASVASTSLQYSFTDPDDNEVKWRPSISFIRKTGEDVRSGGTRENMSVLSFGLLH
ncbi:MAG: hypothetical protein HGA99_04900 [Chlorobiaceae bacterium]|nr:hypothetical protein [Chlorobiaceae bacterium]